MEKQKLWTKNFVNIALSNLFVFLTFYYLLVTLPVYALDDLQGSEFEAGLIITVFLLSAIFIRPFAGKWIETQGKRKIMIASLLIFTGASCLYFIPDSIIGLLVLRFIHGIGFGMATTAAGAIVADIIPDARKGEGMGYFVMSTNLAMVIGPFLGLTVLHHSGITMVFTLGVICAALALITGLFIKIPFVAEQNVRKPNEGRKKAQMRDLFEFSAIPISVVGALFGLIYSSILSFVSVHAEGIGLVEVSSFFFVIYALILLLSRPFTGRWFDQYGANWIIYPAIICFAIGMGVLGIATTSLLFLVSAGLIGLGWGTLFPSFQTLAIQAAPSNRRATATATFLSTFDLGIGIGSSVVGIIGSKIGFGSFYFYSSFYVLFGILIYYFLHDRKARQLLKTKTVNEITTPM